MSFKFISCLMLAIALLTHAMQAYAQVEVTSYVKYKSYLIPVTNLVDPIAPTGLSAEMNTPLTLTIEWNSHVAAEEFVLFWKQPGETAFTEIYRGPATRIIRPNLNYGQYQFRAQACGGALCSNLSAIVSATVIVANDEDLDGVLDHLDQCPDTFWGQDVDQNGCSNAQRDDDEDGVNNELDLCPGTPPGVNVSERGCEPTVVDNDGDGITNDLDACANTAQGEQTNSEGCAADQVDPDLDGDGILNTDDAYPLQHNSQCVGV